MKRILSALLLLATLAVATSLYAASTPLLSSSGGTTLVSSVTVTNAETKTAGLGDALWVPAHDSLSLDLRLNSALIGTGVVNVVFARSLDGVNFETIRPITWTVQPVATNSSLWITNFPAAVIGPCPYIKVYSIQNTATNVTSVLTGVTIRAATKAIVTK